MPNKVSAAPVPGRKRKVRKTAKTRTKRAAASPNSDAPRPPDGKCRCGCGGTTARFFVPGHDARFKGWLAKIARGEGTPREVMGAVAKHCAPWKKKGKGKIPSHNYDGSPI